MALTRKFLTALGIEDEKIDEIITAHSETVNALKGERDNYKANADKLPNVEKELNELKKTLDGKGENPFEKKYNTLKQEFEDYKGNVEAENTKRAKTGVYRALAKKANIGEKYIDGMIKLANLDDIELDESGNAKDEQKIIDAIKNEYPEFVVKTDTIGANTTTPPSGSGGSKMTKEQIMNIKDTAERQKAMVENAELFGI